MADKRDSKMEFDTGGVSNENSSKDFVVDLETYNNVENLQDTITEGLSQLGRSADGTMQVFLTLTLNNLGLRDVSFLQCYKHLQTIILSQNQLSDLTVLDNMDSLVKLDVSHNKLTRLLNFKPSKSLVDVNYAHNLIQDIPDLSEHRCLVTLILDYNNIDKIDGLSSCCSLKNLHLSYNKIERIEGLLNLPIAFLNLSNNKIKRIENLESLKYLKVLDLSYNFIRSLKGLQGHDFLQEINLESNQIIDIADIRYIRELKLLRMLNFNHNPIQELNDYRLSILFRLQMLTSLDETHVTAHEKVNAANMFHPCFDVIAARDHMVHVVRSLTQPAKVFDSTLSSLHTPYPILVLTGPSGCGKRYLVKRLCQEFPDYFGVGVSTTTRTQRKNEEDGLDYYFTSQEEFEHDVMEGKFLETIKYGGYHYGLTRQAVEFVARKGLACAFHMEYEGVLSLKNSSFEPRYVLLLPETSQEHERRLREDCCHSESLIHQALSRADMYADINRQKPGFFDVTFVNDDIEVLYRELKMLVLDYLGFSPTVTTNSYYVGTAEILCSTATSENYSKDSEDSTVTTSSRAWSRPKSNISTNFVRRNISFQSSEVSSLELASLKRRRALAKAALVGIPYISKEHLSNNEQVNELSERMNSKISSLLHFQRSFSAPVDQSNVSLLMNTSNTQEHTSFRRSHKI